MFLAEYGEEKWDRQYGADGTMPFRENNTIHRFDYDREHERYGGSRGMEVSEHHFEFSSDQILRTIATTNVHVRAILLGQAAQQTLLMAYAFFDNDEAIGQFFLHYRRMWEASYDEPSDAQHEKFDQSYKHIREAFLQRIADIRRAARDGDERRSTSVDLAWLRHAREIRSVLESLYRDNELSFRDGAVPGNVEGALTIALSSYIHMSNNRLGISILDEVYISYMVCRALDTSNLAEVM